MLAKDTATLAEMTERHRGELSALRSRFGREKNKLVAKWRNVEEEVKAEQAARLKSLRFRQAAQNDEMAEAQHRELEQFRTVFELQAQLKMAESRSKVELVSFVSHEIRNPLAGVS